MANLALDVSDCLSECELNLVAISHDFGDRYAFVLGGDHPPSMASPNMVDPPPTDTDTVELRRHLYGAYPLHDHVPDTRRW